MGLIDRIKETVKKSGNNKGKFIYFREGVKTRIRFLQDLDDGMCINFHDSYEKSIAAPCQEHFGRNCPYCEMEGIRTREQYIWSVWDYEAKEVKLLMSPVNNYSPVPALLSMYETYGTMMDRDYIITVNGKQTNKSFSVVPMDKVKFRNEKAKPFSESSILKFLDKAWPVENEEEDEAKKSKKAKVKSKKVEEEWEDEEEETNQYEDMSAKELYKLCKEREIECMVKKPEKYYINLLEEDDKTKEDWEDEEENIEDDYDDEDEWD